MGADLMQARRDVDEVIRWLAANPDEIAIARAVHVPDAEGLCWTHNERWPCLLRRMADEAVAHVPVPRDGRLR